MYELDINLLRDEAQRLLKQEIKVLEQIQSTPNLLVQTNHENTQTLDSESIVEAIKRLEDESYKLNNLELVIAVVGTMKAGKSTTINAIVGMEVLPNRNRPMTALPTLIRHTRGVTEPRLIFQNTAPVNTLVNELSEKLKNAPNSLLKELNENDDMQELLEQVRRKQSFSENHEGSDAIFNFLKSLNDLVRLCTELEVDFPFSAYSRIESLPVIEVEFIHLSQMGHMQGRLTLLDTPGPNEAGQSHLRPMLRDQLKKASAILAVLDYTQLKSDADNEMRENLEEVASVSGERLYALVNRFDQKDRNSDSSDEVRKYVSSNLMKGLIPTNRVYPVSARYGYLASQAKNELAINECLPSHDTHEWVTDFAKIAIGGFRWKDQINDIETVTAAANYLWEESQFNEPLEHVIRQAYSKAAILTIDSTASKMVEIAENAKNFLGTRKQAFKKSVDELQLKIVSLQDNIDFIQNKEKAVSKDTNSALNDVRKGIQIAGQVAQKETLSILDTYFKEGKRIERTKQKEKKKELSGKTKKKGIESPIQEYLKRISFGGYSSTSDREEDVQDFEFNNKPLKFEDKNEAEELLNRIEASIEAASKDAEETLRKEVQQQIQSFSESFQGYVDETKKVIDNIKKDMGDFDLIIRLPDVKDLQLGFAIDEVLDDATQKRKEKETRSRRKSGAWGKICSWFNTNDWGWEDYSVDVDVYYVDIKSIKAQVKKGIGIAFSDLEKTLGSTVEAQLNEQADSFFTALTAKVEHIRGDLIASMDDRKKSQEDQRLLLNSLEELEKPIPHLLGDSEAILKDVRGLLLGVGTVK